MRLRYARTHALLKAKRWCFGEQQEVAELNAGSPNRAGR
jgi:hypothetical protein